MPVKAPVVERSSWTTVDGRDVDEKSHGRPRELPRGKDMWGEAQRRCDAVVRLCGEMGASRCAAHVHSGAGDRTAPSWGASLLRPPRHP